jgi:hypothetical protein
MDYKARSTFRWNILYFSNYRTAKMYLTVACMKIGYGSLILFPDIAAEA